MPDKIITVERKQAPTPMNIVTPKLLNPRQMENTREPKANIGRADPIVTVYNFNFPIWHLFGNIHHSFKNGFIYSAFCILYIFHLIQKGRSFCIFGLE